MGNGLIEQLKQEMAEKNSLVNDLQRRQSQYELKQDADDGVKEKAIFNKFNELNRQISEAELEEAKWTINVEDDVNMEKNMGEQEMKAIFDEFDEDKGGSIDPEELQNALSRMGRDMDMDEINELILEIDENGDGEVDFEEFKVMATKSWFVNTFQSKLVKSMQRMMDNMDISSMEDDEFDDQEDEKELVDDDDQN